MNNENIIAGVSAGGFTNQGEIKILICHILNSVSEPLSKDDLNYIFQATNLVNYFMFSQALASLIESEHLYTVNTEHGECFALNPLGVETATVLKKALPLSVRDRVTETANELLAKMKKERENEVEIKSCSGGYNVNCIIHDTDFDLLRFELLVPNEEQALKVKANFLKNPLEFYRTFIEYLTKD